MVSLHSELPPWKLAFLGILSPRMIQSRISHFRNLNNLRVLDDVDLPGHVDFNPFFAEIACALGTVLKPEILWRGALCLQN